jgi:anti-sigma factor RsiW
MSDIGQHDNEWNDRLQDLLDADVSGSERAAVESHVASCTRCRAEFARLKKLDGLLNAQVTAPCVTRNFDEQIYARIDADDAQSRERARRRIDRELEENLATLAKDWRRGLLSLVSGAIAGIALALALMTWMEKSGLTDTMITMAQGSVGSDLAGLVRTLAMLTLGAVIGGIVSRWLISTID